MKVIPPFVSELGCFVHGLHYDFATRRGTATLAAGGCTDMAGCIALFQRIDPDVRYIKTFSGSRPDTWYTRDTTGTWQAYESTINFLLDEKSHA
jgi:hypothetical protein